MISSFIKDLREVSRESKNRLVWVRLKFNPDGSAFYSLLQFPRQIIKKLLTDRTENYKIVPYSFISELYQTTNDWGARTETRKKKMAIAPLVAVLILLSTSTLPVKAQEAYSNVLFGCEAKGPGLVIWGFVGMADRSFGTYEYYAVFDKSDFGFAGASRVEVVKPPDPTPWLITTLLCSFKEGTVHAGGLLNAKWVHDGKHYELTLALWSNRDTLGAYVEMLSPPPNFVRMLDVGLDAAGSFDPKVATLPFLGIFKVNGVMRIVSGRALVGILRVTTGTVEQSSIGVNLWINELHTYAQIAWTSTTQQITVQPPSVSVTLPAATVFKTYVKLA